MTSMGAGKVEVTCSHCGEGVLRFPSDAARATRHFCSRPCRFAAQNADNNPNWRGGLVSRRCEHCGQPFEVKPYRIGYRSVKYCSRPCRKAATQIYPDKRTKVNEAKRRRRARVRAATAIRSHTYAEWLALIERYKHRCAKCSKKRTLTRDHIVPLSHGGHDGIDNIQPLCGPCNSRKKDRREMLL